MYFYDAGLYIVLEMICLFLCQETSRNLKEETCPITRPDQHHKSGSWAFSSSASRWSCTAFLHLLSRLACRGVTISSSENSEKKETCRLKVFLFGEIPKNMWKKEWFEPVVSVAKRLQDNTTGRRVDLPLE